MLNIILILWLSIQIWTPIKFFRLMVVEIQNFSRKHWKMYFEDTTIMRQFGVGVIVFNQLDMISKKSVFMDHVLITPVNALLPLSEKWQIQHYCIVACSKEPTFPLITSKLSRPSLDKQTGKWFKITRWMLQKRGIYFGTSCPLRLILPDVSHLCERRKIPNLPRPISRQIDMGWCVVNQRIKWVRFNKMSSLT